MNTDDNISRARELKIRDLSREQIARWLFIASIALLMYSYVAIGMAWVCAYQTERLPNALIAARSTQTGHGPWDHQSDLRQFVEHGMVAPCFAMILAIMSALARRRTLSIALVSICIISGIAIAAMHFWLID